MKKIFVVILLGFILTPTFAQKFEEPIYQITGGEVLDFQIDSEFKSLLVSVDTVSDGELTIILPRQLIDAKLPNGQDDIFFVLVDGDEPLFKETVTSTDRTLRIPFSEGTMLIEIIGTHVLEETKLLQLSDEMSKIKETDSQEQEVMEEQTEPETSGGGCLIATATFGSEMAPQVQFLREIRDNTVMSTQSGASFMTAFNAFYYSFSPTVADLERQNPVFKETVKIAITPLLSSLTLLKLFDIDTEEEMLGYGIGIILMNIGMYFVAPALVFYKLKNIRK